MKTTPWWRFMLVWAVVQIGLLAAAFYAGRYYTLQHGQNAGEKVESKGGGLAANASITPTKAKTDVADAWAALKKIMAMPASDYRDRALLVFVDGLDVETAKRLVTEHPAEFGNGHHHDEITEVLLRWTELDPHGAFDWARQAVAANPSYDARGTMQQVAELWALNDPQAAIAAVSMLPASQAKIHILESILGNMAEQDPQAALALLPNILPIIGDVNGAYTNIFDHWAENDPASAAAAAQSLSSNSLRDSALFSVTWTWSQQDPMAAFAWANTLPQGIGKDNLIGITLQGMARQNAPLAANYALSLLWGGRENTINIIANEWARQDPAAALAWADKNLAGNEYEDVAGTAIKNMAATNPTAAAAMLAQIKDPSTISQGIQSLATDWAQQDVQGALKWVQTLPTDNVSERSEAIATILSTWASNDPASAAVYVQSASTDPNFAKLAESVAISWSSADPSAALAWAQQLPAGEAQKSAELAVLRPMTLADPNAALAAAQQFPPDSRNEALAAVATAWSAAQPAQAAAILQTLAPGANLDEATKTVVGYWLQQDPSAASQWINTLPAGSARDAAVTTLLSNGGNNQPSTAFDWALSIGDATSRNTQVINVLQSWSEQDLASAGAALTEALDKLNNLSPEQQKQVEQILSKYNARPAAAP